MSCHMSYLLKMFTGNTDNMKWILQYQDLMSDDQVAFVLYKSIKSIKYNIWNSM